MSGWLTGTGPVVVVGLGATGAAVTHVLRAAGRSVTVVEDHLVPPATDAHDRVEEARALGAVVVVAPELDALDQLLQAAAMVVPSPGVDAGHPLLRRAGALGVPVVAEIELAWERSDAPIVAVTGTNGKTTVTTLIAVMLEASGVAAVAAGNIGPPLIEAVVGDHGIVVAEVSSFQLEHVHHFRPRVGVHLNLAEDHLDRHGTMQGYADAKARLFAQQAGDDLLVFSLDDPWVARTVAGARARAVGVTLAPRVDGAWSLSGPVDDPDTQILDPAGKPFVAVSLLPQRLPHQVANAMAATAAALDVGGRPDDIREVLEVFRGLPHRLTLVGEWNGRRFYDDSKATNPHATLAAVRGFQSAVLIAGGRNKGLDLAVLRAGASHLRSVVAIGEAAGEVEAAFVGVRPVTRAGSMREAVALAAADAREGDAVLLSPACASYDWYRHYGERGDDFAAEVLRLVGRPPDRGPL